ncbi:hypothetical protein KI387_027523, partial [Taxus chinensis]
QRDLLQAAMANWSASNVSNRGQEKVLTNAVQPGGGQPSKNLKPPPFYVSLVVGNHLVHNCMIDSGASSSVMPKQIVDQLGLKTRYGAKATIRSEPIANFHIEPHVPSPINANCSAFDQEECSNDLEIGTKVEGIPDLTLDEWANKSHEFDPYKEIEESKLG